MMSNGACAPRSASARMRSSEVGSAQCRSSKASTTGLRPRGRQNPCRHRRQLPAAQFLRREFRGPVLWQEDIDQGREQGRVFGWVQADQHAMCSRGRRGAVRRAGPRRSAGGPIRRSGAAACSATAATTTTRPRCAASRRGGRETPRSASTCPGQARRRSARVGPRLCGRAPSAG